MTTITHSMIKKSSYLLLALALALPQACKTAGQPGGKMIEAINSNKASLGRPLARAVTPVVVRGWIEARVRALGAQGPYGRRAPGSGRPLLALLGDCRFDDLERWQTMLELMGLA